MQGLKANFKIDVILGKNACIDTVIFCDQNIASQYYFPYLENEIFRVLTLTEGTDRWKPRREKGRLSKDTISLKLSYTIPGKKELESNQHNYFKSELENWSINQSLKLIDEGNYEKALPTISKAIEMNPKNSEAYLLRGNCYIFLDRIREACVDFYNIQCTGRIEVEEFISSYCQE